MVFAIPYLSRDVITRITEKTVNSFSSKVSKVWEKNERNWDNQDQQCFVGSRSSFSCLTKMKRCKSSLLKWCDFVVLGFIIVVCCTFFEGKMLFWNGWSFCIWNVVGGVTVSQMAIWFISKDHLLAAVWPLNNLFEGKHTNNNYIIL
jgi:hypothetical protein